MDLLHLQNGSDIRGIAISTHEHTANLTQENVQDITKGVINWLCQNPVLHEKYQQGTLTIGVGRDSRLSGPSLSQTFRETALAFGVNIIDFGLATTPAMFMSTQYEQFKTDAGIMFTASHLPFYFNGIKIFSQTGGAEHEDIEYILTHTQTPQSQHKGNLQYHSILPTYAKDLVQKIQQGCTLDTPTPLKDMHIIVDAGNGAGGFFAKEVLAVLGADISGSQFLEPDGNFPNHIPNPDNKEAMESIKQAVLRHQADLGIIFDTDVDRSAVVTKDGQLLNRNNLIAILSYIVLSEHPNTSIVTNSPTSEHLKNFIHSLGGKQVRYISGYRNVINRAIDLNNSGTDCQLAIETSGHAAFKENYFLDDGTYAVAKILMLLPRLLDKQTSLSDLIATLKQPAQTQEVRFKLEIENYQQYGRQIIDNLRQKDIVGFTLNHDNEEGVRFDVHSPYGSGWFLLRMSLHEPLLVLQIENDEKGYIPAILRELHQFFNDYTHLNQEKLIALL
ncbi:MULTISPECIES: phosphomannomutase/phosphoglucomutase [unclassified Granulicatella]|uniref:phosphomannomutase/phosphoglucomutase n=1 Tax=unclassified Granulicatella TaxID=2630493 RepID=UPI0010737FDA|nr:MULTISPECIES: phosphomannomutase/phosphoglucomutase [unclassified Granulicatella]MBF0781075.1 phosphomannomutase/phosphoglucomutase [Granulicatella sp. 19428wC4_WM01]TFU92247.1 phosphomannomutase/phosphoglucomutase [Granulicatella sp. WM01]